MDRVLVDHMSTWQYVYDRLKISNEEAFNLTIKVSWMNGIG